MGFHEKASTIIWYSDLVAGRRTDRKMLAIKKITAQPNLSHRDRVTLAFVTKQTCP